MTRYAHITGWGMSVPTRIVTNDDLARIVDTTDEWIRSRSGIRQRRIAGPRETTASLGAEAALKALSVANLPARQVGLIIVATTMPEYYFPSTACVVQDLIGAANASAFDLSAACSGFVYALSVATQMITGGAIDSALIIGSETMSRFLDWSDRSTCVLFGDGAGAVVLQASDRPGGVLSFSMHADGSGGDLLMVPAGGSHLPTSAETIANNKHTMIMNGREVYRFATRVMSSSTREVVEKAGLTLQDIDLIIPHQANLRIIESSAKELELPMDRFVVNIDRYANTSAATIPIALCEALQDGRIAAGHHLVFVAFGAGLTWASAVVKWTAPATRKPRRIGLTDRVYARIRSIARRTRRRIEGLIWGGKSGA
jgi:3-oxoacyl-[acyl-carrier-protein] synthase III